MVGPAHLVRGGSQPRGGPGLERRVIRGDRYLNFVLDEEKRVRGDIVLGFTEEMGEEEQFLRGTPNSSREFFSPI